MNWRARISPNLVIIAVCARPYVAAAAQIGYKIAAFDVFNDVETRRLSFISEAVRFSNGGFDADDLWRKLAGIDCADVVVTYGSGVENQPEMLEMIARRFQVAGNSSNVVSLIKDPCRFFPLLDELEIDHPEIRLDTPVEACGWLAKRSGGSGGTHIRLYGDGHHGDYYQRFVAGMPISMLFLADGKNIEVIGYNEQWLAPAPGMPFRYGGIVGNVALAADIKASMADAASKVASAVGLRGLNSMDFVLSGGVPLALEVNPRLSASFDLYAIPDLFERHLQACRGELNPLPGAISGSKASLVYYASHDIEMHGMEWPAWTVDQPLSGTFFKSGEPVCSIIAQAHDADAAKALVFARARELDAQLQTLQRIPGK